MAFPANHGKHCQFPLFTKEFLKNALAGMYSILVRLQFQQLLPSHLSFTAVAQNFYRFTKL